MSGALKDPEKWTRVWSDPDPYDYYGAELAVNESKDAVRVFARGGLVTVIPLNRRSVEKEKA